jgi:ribosome biogenesis SPOUT family RNA methylase Rps3
MQLATDTAVLISRLILCNRLPLKTIPMVEAPTVRGLNRQGEKTTVQMEGFSYVSRELDIETGQLREGLGKKEKREIYMSEGVRDLLLRDDLDQHLLM